MLRFVATVSVTIWIACPAAALAQEPSASAQNSSSETAPSLIRDGAALFPANEPSGHVGFWRPFRAIPNDFMNFLSADTLKVVAIGGIGAVTAHRWDGNAMTTSQAHFRAATFNAGNLGGGFLVQAGSSFGFYAAARLAGSDKLASVGADLTRAQVLSQTIVMAGKFASQRPRPDGSDRFSLPSGHTASAFATATVLQRHFGWKAGMPAYGFGAYVAASRMAANKHHLSDVLFGAAIGVAAGRTVTMSLGSTKFDMAVVPVQRGAAISFTRR
jgi:membrane-associated phospholipid phosphatase